MLIVLFVNVIACQTDCSQCVSAGAGKCDGVAYCDSSSYYGYVNSTMMCTSKLGSWVVGGGRLLLAGKESVKIEWYLECLELFVIGESCRWSEACVSV